MAYNEQEANRLLLAYQNTHDPKIKNALCAMFLPIVVHIATKYRSSNFEFSDIVQEGSLALVKAIDRFDPAVGVKFTTFMAPHVEGAIKNFFRDYGTGVKVPRQTYVLANKIKRLTVEYELVHEGKSPTVPELAKMLDAREEDVIQALEYKVHLVSVETGGSRDHDESVALDIPSSKDTYEEAEHRILLQNALAQLTKEERLLVQYRFIKHLSQVETAAKLGVSQMSVSRRETSIKKKLKQYLHSNP